MSRVLVTGGAGYIGSHTVQKLLEAGFQVVVYDNLSTGFQEAIPRQAVFVQGDVRDCSLLTQVIKEHQIQAVLHLAGKLNIAESIEIPQEYYDNNAGGMSSLVEACKQGNVGIVVFSSTCTVYGNSVPNGIVTEETTPEPINPYGQSKLMSERILQQAESTQGLRSLCLRYFNIAGASADGTNGQRTAHPYHLIHVAALAATGQKKQISVFGCDYPTADGTCIRDYIHVEDIAEVHLASLQYLLAGGESEVLNCGYGRGYSVLEVISAMKQVSGVNFLVELTNRRPGDPANLIADVTKIKEILNWTPKRDDISLICRSAYEWELRRSSQNLI